MTVRDPFHYFLPAPNALSVFLVLLFLESLTRIAFGKLPFPQSIEQAPLSGEISIYAMFGACILSGVGSLLQIPFRITPITWRITGVWLELMACFPISAGAVAYALAVREVNPQFSALAYSSTIGIAVVFLVRAFQISRSLYRIGKAADFLRFRDARREADRGEE